MPLPQLFSRAEAKALLAPWAALAPDTGWSLLDAEKKVIARVGWWAKDALPATVEVKAWPLNAGPHPFGALLVCGPRTTWEPLAPLAQQAVELFLMQALERHQLANETLERYREINLIYRLSEALGAARQLHQIGEQVLVECRNVIRADGGALFLYTGETYALQLAAHFDTSSAQTGPAFFKEVIQHYQAHDPAIILTTEPPMRQVAEGRAEASWQAAAAWQAALWAPLKIQTLVLGGLVLGRTPNAPAFVASDQKLLTTIAGQTALAVENARLFEDLQHAFSRTLEIKTLLDDIFTSIPSAIITVGPAHTITTFNQAAENLLGVPAARALARPLPELFPVLWALAQQALTQGGPTALEEMLLPRNLPLTPVPILATAAPLRDGQAAPKGVALVLTDLTRQKQLETEREHIHQVLGRVIAPRVRDRLLADPRSLNPTTGIRQTVTVVFADLHQFTAFSEVTPPETLLRILNGHLTIVAQAVLAEEGTLDKFMGDAVMAFWNAPDAQPDHGLRAVRAMWRMLRDLETYHANLPALQRLRFSVGIASGEAMVGKVGTPELFNYTVIGDTVNLAQRLEDLAEPGQILLSDAAYQAVATRVQARALPPVQLRGRQQTEMVYELLQLTVED